MDAAVLKLLPPREARVIAVITRWPGWSVVFDNNTQCLIDPDPTPGQRRLYCFSLEIIEKSPWVKRYDDVIIVADTLAFLVVQDFVTVIGDRRLLCEYKGMRS
jgi:hypothetical protein